MLNAASAVCLYCCLLRTHPCSLISLTEMRCVMGLVAQSCNICALSVNCPISHLTKMCKIPEDCFQPFNAVWMCSSILYICMISDLARYDMNRSENAQRRRRRGLTQWCIGTSSHRARIICTGDPDQMNHQHCLLSQIAAWLDNLDLAQDVTCLTHGSLLPYYCGCEKGTLIAIPFASLYTSLIHDGSTM